MKICDKCNIGFIEDKETDTICNYCLYPPDGIKPKIKNTHTPRYIISTNNDNNAFNLLKECVYCKQLKSNKHFRNFKTTLCRTCSKIALDIINNRYPTKSQLHHNQNKKKHQLKLEKRRRNKQRNKQLNKKHTTQNSNQLANVINTSKKSHLTQDYINYIKSPEWRLKRKQRMKIDNYKCECGRSAKHVHHLTYKNLFNENMEDLRSLCILCHDAKHIKKD